MKLDWKLALLDQHQTIEAAIRCLDQSALQIVMVVTSDLQFVGTLTDGDIRRGILRGLELKEPISSIVNRQSFIVPPGMASDVVLTLMQTNRLHQIPIVGSDGVVVGLHIWDKILSVQERDNVIVIMAGGMGRRMMPHTESCPKPMLSVKGKPILLHIIERAKSDGFSNFVLCVNYLAEQVCSYFGDGSSFQVKISYVRENEPLGTAGALSLLDGVPSKPFIVTNGDVLSEIKFSEVLDFHCRNQAMATMAVRQHEWQHPFGVVKTSGIEITGFVEKPLYRTHVNAGVYVFDPVALKGLQYGRKCDMPELFSELQKVGHKVVAYPLHEQWLDVGRPVDLEIANLETEEKYE